MAGRSTVAVDNPPFCPYYVLSTHFVWNAHMTTRRPASPAQQAIVAVLRLAGHVQRALGDVCGGYGITHDQYNVLRILRGVHPDGHPRYEIAQRLISRAPDVTRMLDRLERLELIERVRSAEDRRLSLSRITAAGLALLETMESEIRGVHEHFAGALGTAERLELARLCAAALD
jgi:DNA-binding MarR family transcriptional regulator